MTSTHLKRVDAVLVLTIAVSSLVLTGTLLEAVTDRDWSVRGWEWPEVLVAASVLALGALWLVSIRRSPEPLRGGSTVKRLVKSELERRGYRISRVLPLASQPDHALDVDFEYVLAHYLARRERRDPFFFVQIGAFDGVSFDRLHRHVVDGRWHGVLVEPQAEHFRRLVANYKGLDGLTFVNAAVDSERGSRPLFVIEDEAGNPIASLAGLASLSRERLEDWRRRDGHKYPAAQSIGAVPVDCVTFEDILLGVERVDLLEIDAEGYDLELLRVFDFDRYAPAIVRFEHAHLSRTDWDEAVALLRRHGYRVVREEYDTTGYAPPMNRGEL
jgi:FkbM family methyltransferase